MMLAALALCFLLPAPCQQPESVLPPTFARVGTEPAVVRAFTHRSMPVVAELAPGTPLRVVVRRDPWVRVEVPGGLVLWVYGNYVDREGDAGTINSAHVRARPLPSTGAESYPVGQFERGDAVGVLGAEGDWLRVRAPERLGGWIELASLVELAGPAEGWDEDWRAAAARRGAAPERPVVVEGEPGAAVPAIAPPAVGAAQAANAAVPPDAAAVPSLAILGQAEADLAKLAAGPWQESVADAVGSVFGSVLWASADVVLADRARADLARLETLREAHQLELKVEAEKARLASEARAADAAAVAAARAAEPAPPTAAEGFTLVGWLEYRPAVYSAVPYVIVTAGREQPVLSRHGRYDLKEYVGREIAVLGGFRPSTRKGLEVLEIDRLRVLPKRTGR